MNKEIKITVINNNEELTVEKGITVYGVYKIVKDKLGINVIGAKVNYEITNMNTELTRNCQIEFFDKNDLVGAKFHKYGLEFVFLAAVKDLFKNKYNSKCEVLFDHSIGQGVHVTVASDIILGKETLEEIKEEMQNIISADLPFIKLNVSKKDAYNYFESSNELEKARNVHNTMKEIVTLYKLKDYLNYFYTEMPYSTGCLDDFNLIFLNDNMFGLMLSEKYDENEVGAYKKVTQCFSDNKKWAYNLEMPCIADINQLVSESRISEVIQVCEARYEELLLETVEEVKKQNAKYLMIAGPSSSGKTTTSKKMTILLKAAGYAPLQISVDDYFLNREDTPKDEFGEYDFEGLAAIDVELLNKQLKQLVAGEEVQIPTYDFTSGRRIYDKKPVKLKENGIIILEGLHCVNDEMSPHIDPKDKYKLYISPFIPINIDRHNYISTTDLRMLRRMIRDNRKRGMDVTETIKCWQSVRRGEEKYIFPYLDNANKVINTSLAYEIGVVKVFAEPLLYSVPISSPYYEEARRLILFLSNFFTIPSEYVSDDSVLREFIGSSIFE